ncbi:hypothetical protein AmaxDRAFT_0664 [Limnospira maxima CS-328]|nr:hypothetical protein AmaxDRAFT_0664 [Limnospira maxima CS-328]
MALGQKLAGSGRLLDNTQVAIAHPDTFLGQLELSNG